MAETGNLSQPPKKKRNRGKGRPFKAGQSGNPGGLTKEQRHVRELLREKSLDVFAAGLELLGRASEPSPFTNELFRELMAVAWGKTGPGGIDTTPPPAPPAPPPPPSSGTDLGGEIAAARERLAKLTAKREALEREELEPPAALRRAEAEAADLVRKLVGTQAEVNPGAGAHGNFNVTFKVVGLPEDDGKVPDLVADRQVPGDEDLLEDARAKAAAAAPQAPLPGDEVGA